MSHAPLLPQQTMIESVVDNKVVVIFSNSPTISFIAKNNHVFKNKDFVYGAINLWKPIEKDVLLPINKELDFVCLGRLFKREENVEYAHRDSTNLLITVVPQKNTAKSARKKARVAKRNAINAKPRYDLIKQCDPSKILKVYLGSENGPTEDNLYMFHRMDTIQVLLLCLLTGKPKKIYVFGADHGVKGRTKDFSEKDNEYCHYGCTCNVFRDYHKSTDMVNKVMNKSLELMETLWKIPVPPIIISGIHSTYTFGKRVDKQDVLQMILDEH